MCLIRNVYEFLPASLHFEKALPKDPYDNLYILQVIPRNSYLFHFILKRDGLRIPVKSIVFYKESLEISRVSFILKGYGLTNPIKNIVCLQGMSRNAYQFHFIWKGYGLKNIIKNIMFYQESIGFPTCFTSCRKDMGSGSL